MWMILVHDWMNQHRISHRRLRNTVITAVKNELKNSGKIRNKTLATWKTRTIKPIVLGNKEDAQTSGVGKQAYVSLTKYRLTFST